MTREELIQRYGCCATCVCWVVREGGVGDCWSGDRLDDDFPKGPAGATFAYDCCEAHCPRGPDADFLRLIGGAVRIEQLATPLNDGEGLS